MTNMKLFNSQKDVLFNALEANNVTYVEVTFEGSGDSGCIEDTYFYSTDNWDSEENFGDLLPNDQAAPLSRKQLGQDWPLSDSKTTADKTIASAIEDVVDFVLFGDSQFRGWENDDGGFGNVNIDVKARKIRVEMNQRYIQTDYFEA